MVRVHLMNNIIDQNIIKFSEKLNEETINICNQAPQIEGHF